MSPDHRERLAEAFAFALDAHATQTRKGKSVPYVSHLLQVAGLVLEHGGSHDQAVAALLHDTLEDCPEVTRSDLAERFGEAVAAMVESCTDLLEGDRPDAKSDWRSRKERYIAHLERATRETRLVAACDKLHNLGNLVGDVRVDGLAFLERFNAGIPELLWYQEACLAALREGLPAALVGEWEHQLAELRRLLPSHA